MNTREPSRFTLFKGTNTQFYFNLKAPNGERLLASGSYQSKISCLEGIRHLRLNAPIASRYEKKISFNQFYFILKGDNGDTIGVSDMYTTMAARDKGIETTQREAPVANFEDLIYEKIT